MCHFIELLCYTLLYFGLLPPWALQYCSIRIRSHARAASLVTAGPSTVMTARGWSLWCSASRASRSYVIPYITMSLPSRRIYLCVSLGLISLHSLTSVGAPGRFFL